MGSWFGAAVHFGHASPWNRCNGQCCKLNRIFALLVAFDPKLESQQNAPLLSRRPALAFSTTFIGGVLDTAALLAHGSLVMCFNIHYCLTFRPTMALSGRELHCTRRPLAALPRMVPLDSAPLKNQMVYYRLPWPIL